MKKKKKKPKRGSCPFFHLTFEPNMSKIAISNANSPLFVWLNPTEALKLDDEDAPAEAADSFDVDLSKLGPWTESDRDYVYPEVCLIDLPM